MKNKKVLLVGTSFSAIPLLKKLKKNGLRVFVCGGLKNDPCHFYADKSFYIDYSNKKNLLKLCEEEKFDYIIPCCNDYSYMSCSFVASELDLNFGFDNYEISKLLHTKKRFREFTQKNGFSVPKFVKNDEIDNIKDMDITFPLLVKPNDSFSGKGISKIDSLDKLHTAIDFAKDNSRDDEIIIEEFVNGTLHSHSAFIKDKNIEIDFFVDEYCSVYPYQVDSSSLSVLLPENIKNKIREEIKNLVSLLGLSDGLIHTQFIYDGNNKFWLIETMRRCPGDLYGNLIYKSTNKSYQTYYCNPFVENILTMDNNESVEKYFIRHTISSKKEIIFESVQNNIPTDNIEFIPLKDSGLILREAPYDKIGIIFAEFKSKDDLIKYTPIMKNFIKINSLRGIINE